MTRPLPTTVLEPEPPTTVHDQDQPPTQPSWWVRLHHWCGAPDWRFWAYSAPFWAAVGIVVGVAPFVLAPNAAPPPPQSAPPTSTTPALVPVPQSEPARWLGNPKVPNPPPLPARTRAPQPPTSTSTAVVTTTVSAPPTTDTTTETTETEPPGLQKGKR